MEAMKKSLYTPHGYKLALTALGANKIGTEEWKAAKEIVDSIVDGMLANGSTWMCYEMCDDLNNMIEEAEESNNEKLNDEIDKLIDTLFNYGFEEIVRERVALPDRW